MEFLSSFRKEQGVAGLNILLSVIVSLFMIGMVVMVLAIVGAEMQDSITDSTARIAINDTILAIDDVTDWFPTIIVIAAMVVLVVLVVLAIGYMQGMTGGLAG